MLYRALEFAWFCFLAFNFVIWGLTHAHRVTELFKGNPPIALQPHGHCSSVRIPLSWKISPDSRFSHYCLSCSELDSFSNLRVRKHWVKFSTHSILTQEATFLTDHRDFRIGNIPASQVQHLPWSLQSISASGWVVPAATLWCSPHLHEGNLTHQAIIIFFLEQRS